MRKVHDLKKDFNKAPGQQWVIRLSNERVFRYVLEQKRFDVRNVLLGQFLCRSTKAFKSTAEAQMFIKQTKVDERWNYEIVDFVDEMKNLIANNLINFMVDEEYVRIICENHLGEKLYVKHDPITNQLYPEKEYPHSLVCTVSESRNVINKIEFQKKDKYKNFKTESL